jgi:hypothetical protein
MSLQRSILVALAALPTVAANAQLVRSGTGPDAASIQSFVDQFRADISVGGPNNGAGGGPFATGRREINWDAPGLDAFQSPALFPANFFNSNSRRGAQFSTPGSGFLISQRNAANPSDPNLRFGDVNPSYNAIFNVFTPQRLFAAKDSTITDVTFFVPDSPTTAATVNGFGAVFTDVDSANSSRLDFYGLANELLFSQYVAPGSAPSGSLSFLGVSFAAERISRVRITSGDLAMSPLNNDGPGADIVALDDFIYGEPQSVPGPAGLAGLGLGLILTRRRRA